MASVEERPRFHLAIGVDDLEATAHFYGEVLGCSRGRSDTEWIDWNLYGHQVVTHHILGRAKSAHNGVDGHDVPVPHFGIILTVNAFHELSRRLQEHAVTFLIEPHVRFVGEVGEQWTMFFLDPSDNAIECKAFADDDAVFRN